MTDNTNNKTQNKSSIVVLIAVIAVIAVIAGVIGFGLYQNYSKNNTNTPDEITTTQIATTEEQTTQEVTTVAPTTAEPTTEKPTEKPTTSPPTTEQPTTLFSNNPKEIYNAYCDVINNNDIVCGECGFHYQGNTRAAGRGSQSMYSSYRCGKKQNHKIGCGNSEIEKNRLETFVLEQMQKYLFSDNAIKTIVKQVNEYNISVSKSKNSDLALYEKQLNEINKQIKNITLAIAKGVNQELMIEQIKSLDSSKKDLEKRIEKSKITAFPPIVEEDVRKALSKFKEFMKENNYIECKNFINHYIDKIIVYRDKVEVTFKVASAIFNASFPDDKSGMLKIIIEISRTELKTLPKQRRKVPANGQFGESYLKQYQIAIL